MIIAHMSGGFGNQLFSYAFGYSLAKARGEEFWIDTALQDTEWFFRNSDIMKMKITFDRRLSYKIGRSLPDRAFFNKIRFRKSIGFGTKIIKEADIPKGEDFFEYCYKQKGNLYVKGNWSYEKFFLPVVDEIMERFVFKEPLSDEAGIVANEIKKTDNSVGLHYRLGDYVKIGVVAAPDYFIGAMAEMKEKLGNPTFFVFSEDKNWVKQQFKDLPYDIRYPEYNSEDPGIEDFRLFSMCENQINSNSSFSWWGAYLNKNPNKHIIAPTDYDGGWQAETFPKSWEIRPFTFLNK